MSHGTPVFRASEKTLQDCENHILTIDEWVVHSSKGLVSLSKLFMVFMLRFDMLS